MLIPLTLGWVVAAFTSGQLITKTGRYKIYTLIGSSLVLVGSALLALLDEDSSSVVASLFLVVIGLGMGSMFQTYVIATQNRVPQSELGVATAAIQFFRSMGGSLAVAGLGALLTAQLGAGIDANRLTAGAGHVSAAARSALGDATHAVFVALIPLAAAVFVLSILLPEERLHTSAPAGRRAGDQLELQEPEPHERGQRAPQRGVGAPGERGHRIGHGGRDLEAHARGRRVLERAALVAAALDRQPGRGAQRASGLQAVEPLVGREQPGQPLPEAQRAGRGWWSPRGAGRSRRAARPSRS